MRRPLRRRAFTLLETLFAIVLTLIIMGGVMAFFQTGTRSVVVATDHAQARDDALVMFHAIAQDLDRIIIADDYDATSFPNVVEPILIDDAPRGSKFLFYGFHHREFDWSQRKMTLHGNLIEYRVVPVDPGDPSAGVDLYRNDEDVPLNPNPLSDVRFERIPDDEAADLGISPFHAVRVRILPRGVWDTKNEKLAAYNAQTRLFHLKGIESQFAVLLSLKESGAGPYYRILSDPRLVVPERLEVYRQYNLDQVPLDWLRPQGLVKLNPEYFDYETADEHTESGAAPAS